MTFDEEFDALRGRLRQLTETEARLRADAARADAEAEAAARESALRAQLEAELAVRLDTARADVEAQAAARESALRAEFEAELAAGLEAARGVESQAAEREEALRSQFDADLTSRLETERTEAEQRAVEREHVLRAELESAAEQRLDEARAEAESARARLEGEASKHAEAAEAARAGALTSAARLRDAVKALDAARTLSEVLEILTASAASEVARSAVLVASGDAFVGWQMAGFGPPFETPESIVLARDESGVIAEAVEAEAACSADASQAPAFAALAAGCQCVAAPLSVGGQVVGVLYVDQGSADSGQDDDLPFPPPFLEVLARHAASRLEALTAFRTVAALAESSTQSTDSAGDQAPSSGSRPVSVEDEESARRYARLLVSEIRLYHEADVATGRERRDLGSRLKAEIARARTLYEQRVPPEVRRRTDYFNAELVRTLADGDARILEVNP